MNHFRLIILLFLSFLSFNSFSAVSKSEGYRTLDSRHINAPNLYDLCSLMTSSSYFASQYVPGGATNISVSVNSCSFPTSSITVSYTASNGNPVSSSRSISLGRTSAACPPNSSPSGSQCTCNAGYEEKDGNSCVLPEPPDTCKEIESTCSSFKNERIPRFDVYYSGSTPGGACSNPPLDNCSKGCYLQFTGISVYYKDNEGRSIASGPASFTGDSCVHSDQVTDPDPEKICKPGEFGSSSFRVEFDSENPS